jgi:hypothetical protein
MAFLRPLVEEGFVRQEPVARHMAACLYALELTSHGQGPEALALLDRWLPELSRRSWDVEVTRNTVTRGQVLLDGGDPAGALGLLDIEISEPRPRHTQQLLRLRAERLSGSTGVALVQQLVDALTPDQWTPRRLYLAARAEQALRTSAAARAEATQEVLQERGLLVIHGYMADLQAASAP